MTLICVTNTTLFAGCPTAVTITPAVGSLFQQGDELTCTSDGYDPTYKWIDTTTGLDVSTLNPLTLPTGPFTFACVAEVEELGCSAKACISGTAYSKYPKHDAFVTLLLHCV